jgi:rhamnose utilization protein RhaD (predicted bifunctional aldolase and dehydrogenase)
LAADDQLRVSVQSFCRSIGNDRLLVQGAGGNVSWKSGNTLWIKASGTWLAESQDRNIFVPVDLPAIQSAVGSGHFDYSPKVKVESYGRPSIETLLHAILPHKIVCHLHPVDCVAHMARENGGEAIRNVLEDAPFCWEWVPYYKPGPELAKAVHTALKTQPALELILLQNHGVIFGADSLNQLEVILSEFQQRTKLKPIWPSTAKPTTNSSTQNVALCGYRMSRTLDAQHLCQSPDWIRWLQNEWAICPDHVVFLGSKACHAPDLESGLIQITQLGDRPPFLVLHNGIVYENTMVTSAQCAQIQFYFDVLERQPPSQKLKVLSVSQISSLLDWEAEKYRIKLNEKHNK